MKRTELKRKTPLRNRKGGLPTRSAMRRRAAKPKKADAKAHLARVAAMPCIIPSCRKPGPSTVHHVRHKITRSGTFARVDRRVVPLCPGHHLIQFGPIESVEAIHEAGIFEKFGVDLWAEAERLWEESCAA